LKEIFDEILETFENEDIKEFAKKCIDKAPKYFWEVPASSTFKYHPDFAREVPLGLAKHTVAVCRYLNYILEPECVKDQYTSRERDLLRVSAIVHDMWKSGNQEDYERSKWTRFDHPLISARHIYNMDGLSEPERRFIGLAVSSHMGQWNTDKRNPDTTLPKPKDKYQIILHIADYLASRKDIEMKFSQEQDIKEKPAENYDDLDPKTWAIDFGKHKGKTLAEIEALYPGYIVWLQSLSDFNNEPCKTLLIRMGYKF